MILNIIALAIVGILWLFSGDQYLRAEEEDEDEDDA